MVLFGLSMDYTVLILERAAEARRHGASAREAAAEALGATGATVTSAAIVMIAVFAIFATLPLVSFKELGVGLAAAIAIDATIVRGVALPAVLTLLGDRGLRPAPRPPASTRARRGNMTEMQLRLPRWRPAMSERRSAMSRTLTIGTVALAPPFVSLGLLLLCHLGADRRRRLLLADVAVLGAGA